MTKNNYKLKGTVTACFMVVSLFAQAQLTPLEGIKICLDPGHGGQDSNDRPTELGVGTTYYEAAANWEVIGYLDTMLVKLGAATKVTRITDDPDSPLREPSLSDRVQVANAFGADYFHSFHTNGSDNRTANYTLVLYAGSADNNPDDPNALAMAEIMTDELFVYMRTTNAIARADIPFTGFTNGLGVLNNLNMPGTLSECSFHSNLNEGRRLMSSAYRKAAAWACVKSFLAYYEKPTLPYGEVGGIVTDREGNALNGIKVTLSSLSGNEKVFNGDQFLNGYFLFDRLAPGEYNVLFEKSGYDPQLKTITVSEGKYTEIDAALGVEGGAPEAPILKYVAPYGIDGVRAAWQANGELTLLGYRLYYATDDTQEQWALAADENTLTKAVTDISIASKSDFIDVPDNDVYHFKLVAVVELGAESTSAFTFSRSSGDTGDKILIVDGFDRRDGSFSETYHTFSADYLQAIRETRSAEVTTTRNEHLDDASLSLSNYDLVVWYLGDESTVDETFDASEQSLIKTYLESGGKLLVSGSEVAWDLGARGSEADNNFLSTYLKTQYVRDGSVLFTPAKGVVGTAFEGLEIPFGITYPEDYPDDILPASGAITIFDYNIEDTHGGIAYKGKLGAGTQDGGVIYISFPLETSDPKFQKLVMNASLNYLEVGVAKSAAPIAIDDVADTSTDGLVTIDVLSNDRDINEDLDASSLAIVSQPTHGAVTMMEGKVRYQIDADEGFVGIDAFEYQVSDVGGLVSNTARVDVTVQEVLIVLSSLNLSEEPYKLYPNPSKGTAYLEVLHEEGTADVISWKIFDLEGRQVRSDHVRLRVGSNKLNLNTETLSSGIYLIEILNDNRSQQYKLTKK